MTDEQLTEIYNISNGLDSKRHNPITTERIFAAMRGAIAIEREECALVAENSEHNGGIIDCGAETAKLIRMRSND